MNIKVIKRDGRKEPLEIQKWQAQIAKVCQGVPDVSQSMIEIAAQMQFYDGMTTEEIDKITLRAIVDLIDEESNPATGNVNYQYVAGKQRLSMLRKEVYGEYDVPRLYDIVKKNVHVGLYTKELLEWYTEEEWDKIDSFVEHDKDEELTYAAIEQLCSKYLVQNRSNKKIYETPQVRYAVAAATAFHNEKTDRLKWVKEYYKCSSDGLFTLATPVLAGLGTPTKQFSSCVLVKANDSIDSIFASGEMIARYAAKRAGIGFDFSRIRPLGAQIRKGEIVHTGLVPFLKKWFYDLRSVSQGGIRNASATGYYQWWHAQFEDLIVLKNNQGTDETRVRHIDYNVALCGLLFERFLKKQNVTLFDPNQCEDLYEAFYGDHDKFRTLYEQYEARTDITKKVFSAEEIINAFVGERTDTGRIYAMFVDNVNKQGTFDSLVEPVYMSNLCCEILLPTRSFERLDDENGRIALCTLGSINWGAFRHPEDMKRACKVLVRSLCNLLGYQDFLSIQSELANKEHYPLGVGIVNLAYWHAKRGLKYGETDALEEVNTWMEHQTYYCMEASNEIAKERGAALNFEKLRIAKDGKFHWERRKKGVEEVINFKTELNWEPLRESIQKYGLRNSVLIALPPVESSSVVVNATNGFELPMSLITVKDSKGGSLVQVVPEYKKLKNKYQLMWEQTDCIGYLKTCAVLSIWADQGLSTNTFYNPAHFPGNKIPRTLVIKNILLAYKWGIKTLYYSLINKEGSKEENLTNSVAAPISVDIEEEDCEACKL